MKASSLSRKSSSAGAAVSPELYSSNMSFPMLKNAALSWGSRGFNCKGVLNEGRGWQE